MRTTKLAVCAGLIAGAAFGAEDAPGWLKELANVPAQTYPSKVTAVMLLNDESNVIDETGKITRTARQAVRYISRQADIQFVETYDTDGAKIRDFRAWVISASGKVKRYAKTEIVDVACAPNEVFDECRARVVFGKADAEPGAIFGYEAVVEERTFTNQLRFHFQDMLPVESARFSVTVPTGWEVKSREFNGAPKETASGPGVYTWQMSHVAAIEREPAAPSSLTLTPWVGVTVLGGKLAVTSWPEAAKQMADINQTQFEPDDAITAKAKALTANATTEMDKIRAIGNFTQQVNYVSIQTDVARGGGYRPHSATQVFQKLYGDCKDKANLTRSMLKAVGIQAYPVAIYSGDRSHVPENWPSFGVFNHAISAIVVGPEVNLPAVIVHPQLGRLLLFDSTDPYVQPGYLPEHEQDSLALIGAANGGLIRVPQSPQLPASRVFKTEAELKPDGGIAGSFTEVLTGEAYSGGLAPLRALSKTDFQKSIERWVGRSMTGASASAIEADAKDGKFMLKGQFSSSRFAQIPQSRMMIFRAGLLYHGENIRLREKSRKYPVVLDGDAFQETVRILVPAGFKVDELPDPMKLSNEFGSFEAKWSAQLGS
ncbi:MAG TPA: DUF3857 domain-containing protein, partial [Bryobacteraceae bacterium]